MNKAQSAVLSMVVVASLFNGYGAVKRGSNIAVPVISGFVVATILLALAEVNDLVPEMFAGAFLVTSALANDELVDLFSELTSGKPTASKPSSKSPKLPGLGQNETKRDKAV